MPTTNHRKKTLRQIKGRTLRNRARKSSMRTAIRRVRDAIAAGDRDEIRKAVESAYQRIDKAAKANTIHANTAARRKALVARSANAALASR